MESNLHPASIQKKLQKEFLNRFNVIKQKDSRRKAPAYKEKQQLLHLINASTAVSLLLKAPLDLSKEDQKELRFNLKKEVNRIWPK